MSEELPGVLREALCEVDEAQLEAGLRELMLLDQTTTKLAETRKTLIDRIIQHLAGIEEATTERGARARALLASESGPVAHTTGSGRLAEAFASTGPSVRRTGRLLSAPGSDDDPITPINRGGGGEHHRPGREISIRSERTPIRPGASRDRAPTAPTSYATRAGASQAPASARAQVSAPWPPPHADANSRFKEPGARRLLLQEAGIDNHKLHPASAMTPEAVDLAGQTPDITPEEFKKLFGGSSRHERPQSKKCILMVNRVAQPYAPQSPGESGIMFLFYPDIALREDTSDKFYLFLNKKFAENPVRSKIRRNVSNLDSKEAIYYLGTYKKVAIGHAIVEPNEWSSLPVGCRKTWLRRIHTSEEYGVREMHARISLRNESQGGPPPSAQAIRKWLEQNPKNTRAIRQGDITTALKSGEEKLGFEVIEYVGYDRNIVAKLQKNTT